MKLIYPAIFTPFSDGEEGYVVEFPDLPGCVTEGYSLEEALDMAQDAASGWVLDELEEGRPVPGSSNAATLECPSGSFTSVIALDIDSYAEKYGKKTVRKNITIPAWLNTYGEKQNINFSKVLQDALLSMAHE